MRGGEPVVPPPVVTTATVTFNSNSGSNVASIVRTIGTALGELPVTTREGYDFDGWFTESNGGS
jgi:hypothetical protein